ncbi:MAG: hypothetical protein DKINENOH_04195 [bacterium]|nr:hypothetical protein [bacterium]
MHMVSGKWYLLLWGTLLLDNVSNMKLEAQTIVLSRIVFKDGGTSEQHRRISEMLSVVLQEINRIAAGRGDFELIREYCTPEGFRSLRSLVEQTGCFSATREYHTDLLETLDGQYEVRGIKLLLKIDDTSRGDPVQYLVVTMNSQNPEQIVRVNFAIEANHYERIMEQGKELEDRLSRRVVLNLLEEFRTAHNRKDSTYLEQIYSDDALIIVGQVLHKRERRENERDELALSDLGDRKIRFIRLSKIEYIERLRRVFRKNAFVRVTFDDVEVRRHPVFQDIYGVSVRQHWNSSSYSDSGFLFLAIDFRNRERPLIRVRSWQPSRFEDGTVVTLGNFIFVR